MLAVIIGEISLLVGLLILLIPLFLTELSRPRDAFWGALVLLIGLVLITNSDRFLGSPMIAVICGSFLIGRLGLEVSQSRWQKLSNDEKSRFATPERWTTGLKQVGLVLARLTEVFGDLMKFVLQKDKSISVNKKWVRPETSIQNNINDPLEKGSDQPTNTK